LFEIISRDFDEKDQLLVKSSAFLDAGEKM
jgi:hypothetical protein